MRVLLTRQAEFSEGLIQDMRKAGWRTELFPVIDILPTVKQRELFHAIVALRTMDMALFVSRNAVIHGLKAILSIYPKLPALHWIAIGPGTGKMLETAGATSVLMPVSPPYESENLLELDALQAQALRNKKLMLFRGNGGRELLSEALLKRGAELTIVETYQRRIAAPPSLEKRREWRDNRLDAIISTSKTGLEHLRVMLSEEDWQWFKEIPMIVLGKRMASLANTLGVKQIITAIGADDATLVNALKEIRKKV